MFVPTKLFLTKGVGVHREQLQSFEEALRRAGIQFLNIVSVSSILPPRCEMISKEKGLAQVSDSGAIAAAIDDVIAQNPGDVQDYLAGKQKVLGFFMGQVMRATQGKANPKIVNDMLREKLAAQQ